MHRFDELLRHVEKMPTERIYRTIYDENLNPIVKGFEHIFPWEVRDFNKVDFSGKTVIDMGCNFGWFGLQARRNGAASVLGVDFDEMALDGARILREIHEMDNVEYETVDMEARPSPLEGRKYDIAMLLDFIGTTYILRGLAPDILGLFKSLSDKELLISIRPRYLMHDDLRTTPEHLAQYYPVRFIREDEFLLLDYVRDLLAPDWTMSPLTPLEGGLRKDKRYFLFQRA